MGALGELQGPLFPRPPVGALQQPVWPDDTVHEAVLDEMRELPPLVFAGEARDLTEALAAVRAVSSAAR